jgi:TRAP-type C4-dicarboxylate transport system permease small subunit
MQKIVKSFETAQEWIVVVCIVTMVLSSFLQVLNRNLLKLPISWTEELSRYCMIWMTMFGTGVSLRKGQQMAVVLFEKKIKGKLLTVLKIVASLLVVVFSGLVMVTITELIRTQAASNQLSAALHIHMQYMTFAIFFGMLMIFVLEIVKVARICFPEKQTTLRR